MDTEVEVAYQKVMADMQNFNLLLESDSQLPNVAGIVTGETIRGSWWGHPQSNLIYEVCCRLHDHPDILAIKLISGKITYVERKLWSAVIGVSTAGEVWQLRELDEVAHWLLDKVTREHSVTTDQLQLFSRYKTKTLGDAARDLEKKLIVYGESFHTTTGNHSKRLEIWAHWIGRVGFTEQLLLPAEGKSILEGIMNAINEQFAAKGKLPWITYK